MKLFTPILAITVGCSLLFVGCDLNLEPPTELGNDAVWSDPGLVEAYLNDVYSGVGYGFGDPMIAGLADEAKNTHGHGDAPMLLSNMTPTDRGLWSWGNEVITQYRWDIVYSRIRDLNILLHNVAASQALSADKKKTFLGEAHFLRAFFYHNLMRLHGGVPLIDRVFELGADLEQYQVPRGSFEETVDFIVADLDTAASLLTPGGRRLGAATQGAALALKCRVLLYAASDLYAQNPSGMPETGYTGGDQMARWQAAANACQAVIDLGRYSLTPAPTPKAYHDLFAKGNPGEETIWARYFQSSGGESHNEGLWVSPNGYNSWSGDTPLQEHVDKYEMADGSEFNWADSAEAADPYANRDPRFYANVLYNAAAWRPRPPGLDALDPVGVIETGWFEMPDATLRAGLDTRESFVQNWNGTKTGYNLAKFVDEDLLPDRQQQFNPWPFLRYAEVLLNYAEAAAELGLAAEAVSALNQVRARVGMPDVPPDGGLGRTLIERIRQERAVELAFEEHRYFDVRRWMIAPQAYTNGHGIRVIGHLDPTGKPLMYNGQEYRYRYEYQVIEVDERRWNDKAYFLPIPQDEMDRNPKLVQNPGY
ncbi:MAG TPA: RagB/SusD family nutrient uptake outer membrane protein [Gemmatimonadales bacterium]